MDNQRTNNTGNLRIEINLASELTSELEKSIRNSNDREFGSDSLVYDDPEWYVIGFLEESPVAHVGILRRTITINQTPHRIGGICYLVTEPEYRGRGFGHAVMRKAVDMVKNQLQLPFCLLTCSRRLEALYTSWGWRTVVGPTVYIQEDGPRTCTGLAMIIECGGKAWPDGKIDLCGLPW